MTSTIGDDIRQTFALAAMQREAKHLKTSEQWNRTNEIMQRCARLREQEQLQFHRFYDTRVDAARRRLIDATGQVHRDLRPRDTGSDRFDAEAIRRQAEREVRGAHDRKLIKIGELEFQKLTALVRQSDRENKLRDEVRIGFHRAADRRSAQDRRNAPGPEKPTGPVKD
ncbi:MAG: hypothetical protein WDN25_13620 [Acetobacteraceae bacterium]